MNEKPASSPQLRLALPVRCPAEVPTGQGFMQHPGPSNGGVVDVEPGLPVGPRLLLDLRGHGEVGPTSARERDGLVGPAVPVQPVHQFEQTVCSGQPLVTVQEEDKSSSCHP